MPFGIDDALIALGGLAVSALGNSAKGSAEERAAALQEKGLKEFLAAQVPDPVALKLMLEDFVQTGRLSPELEQAKQLGESEMAKIQADPRLKGSRMRALSSLEDIGSGGESVEDSAALNKALIESGAASRGQQQAVSGALARKGQLGSGLGLMAQLDTAQAEGDRLATQGLDLEMSRRQRALQAIQGAGDLAGDIQSDDWNMQSDVAKSRDAINQFNTQNLQGVMNRNVDRSNDASKYNLNLQQSTADKNTALRNTQQQYNKELLQSNFDNKLKRAAGISGQYNSQADAARKQGQSDANMWGGIGQGVAGLGAQYNADKRHDEMMDYLKTRK